MLQSAFNANAGIIELASKLLTHTSFMYLAEKGVGGKQIPTPQHTFGYESEDIPKSRRAVYETP